MTRHNYLPKMLLAITALFVAAVLTSSTFAQDSLLINYQGRLTDDGGNPLNTTVIMSFTIYDGAGVPWWSETHAAVQVAVGIFTVTLGSEATLPNSVFTGEDRYLGITVGSDPEITPRALLTSAPGAAFARRVSGDIQTEPGSMLLRSSEGDSAIAFVADADTRAIRIHPPEPCVPPDSCVPVFEIMSDDISEKVTLRLASPPDDTEPEVSVEVDAANKVTSMRLSSPPDDNMPAIEFSADALLDAAKIRLGFPPDPCNPAMELATNADEASFTMGFGSPPDDILPGVEVTTGSIANTVKVNWVVPPDDSRPGLELGADALSNYLKVNWSCPPDDGIPAFEVLSDAIAGAVSVRLGAPPDDSKPEIELASDGTTNRISVGLSSPPDDVVPSVELTSNAGVASVKISGADPGSGDPPAIVMSAAMEEARVGIGTETPAEALSVVGNIVATGSITEYSGTGFKTNITPIGNALETVAGLRGVRYNWQTEKYARMHFSDDRQIGLLAEDVEQVLPELVHTGANGDKSVSYTKLTAVLVEAIKELRSENEELKSRISALEKR